MATQSPEANEISLYAGRAAKARHARHYIDDGKTTARMAQDGTMQSLKFPIGCMRAITVRFVAVFSIVLGLSVFMGCSGQDSVIVEGDVAIAYVKRPTSTLGNPTLAISFTAGGDLYLREKSSSISPEINLTASQTQGIGDVSDPEVSYDGSKILFSMRRSDFDTWGVWEYDIARKSLTPIPCTVASGVTPMGDDVDPAYLPDGRIVFASNRQEKSRRLMEQQSGSAFPAFSYLDEYERERTIALHVMNADGTDCHQISFNQSHDRNPTVLQNGQIMYSRWDHVGQRNQFSIFTANPDGTNLFVLYGAHSPGNSYLHPRELPNGQILSTLMPLSGTYEGGALMQINVREYSENCEPGPGVPPGCNGQTQPTAKAINFGMGISRYGRFSTPYPLWDGTNRALVTWTPSCDAPDSNPCPTRANPLTGAPVSEEDTPVYGIYMLDLGAKTMRPVVRAPAGYAVLDPVAIQSKRRPYAYEDARLNESRDAAGLPLYSKTSSINTTGVGVINVKSVYDTDDKELMGDAVLVTGLNESIPKLPSGVADILRLKDPARTTATQRPARFIRITKAVPTEQGTSRLALGETDFEMQQILGYAEVEPDGSFKIEVPADVPLAIAVLDKDGRGFTPHTSWLQVRPGETRTCNGCHSSRRGREPLNSTPIAGNHVNTLMANVGSSGESMAETRTRLDGSALQLKSDIEYQDVWTLATLSRPADAPITIRYSGNSNPGDNLTTAVPATTGPNRGVIDYPTHIQPLWTKSRRTAPTLQVPLGEDRTCTACHSNTAALNLGATIGGSGRLISYDELLVGDPVLVNNEPVIDVIDEELVVRRAEAQVISGKSRASHLIEVLFNQELKSARPLAPPPSLDHSTLLNPAEKRLVAEWIDLGAQYYNSARDSSNRFRGVTGLDEDAFASSVYPILLTHCSGCHQAVGQPGSGASPGFVGRRFVLTGQREGDFNVTLSMIGDRSNPAASELLRRPASDGLPPNPVHGQAIGGGPVMPSTDPDYQCIANWISGAGC